MLSTCFIILLLQSYLKSGCVASHSFPDIQTNRQTSNQLLQAGAECVRPLKTFKSLKEKVDLHGNHVRKHWNPAGLNFKSTLTFWFVLIECDVLLAGIKIFSIELTSTRPCVGCFIQFLLKVGMMMFFRQTLLGV